VAELRVALRPLLARSREPVVRRRGLVVTVSPLNDPGRVVQCVVIACRLGLPELANSTPGDTIQAMASAPSLVAFVSGLQATGRNPRRTRGERRREL